MKEGGIGCITNAKTPQSPAQRNTKVGKQLGCQDCLLDKLNSFVQCYDTAGSRKVP